MHAIVGLLIFTIYLLTTNALPQGSDTNAVLSSITKSGRYIPEVYGSSGKYIPDDSGKYKHVHVPYDGGYGDRGLKYKHVTPPPPPVGPQPFALGPKDHLRFMIDFNYNGTGWQVIQFEWIQDNEQGGENHHYNYVNENRCCGAEDIGYDFEEPVTTVSPESAFHVEGEYDSHLHNLTYSQSDKRTANDKKYSTTDIQMTIHDVLEYIQTNIIPTLD